MLELEYKFEQAAAAKGFFAGKSLEHRRPSSAVETGLAFLRLRPGGAGGRLDYAGGPCIEREVSTHDAGTD